MKANQFYMKKLIFEFLKPNVLIMLNFYFIIFSLLFINLYKELIFIKNLFNYLN